MERKTTKVPIPAPQSPVSEGDEDELNDDLDSDVQTPREEEFESVTEEEWVRVNDKAPIWMRWVGPYFRGPS
jgi:heat shock protein beta